MSDEQEAKQATLDWGAATVRAHMLLTSGAPANCIRVLRDGSLRLDSYWQEPLQNAALRAVRRYRSGVEVLPATTEELGDWLARYARFSDDNRRGLERRQRRSMAENVERITETFDASRALDSLEVIIARDLFEKFAARLFDALDPAARQLLEAWLGEGIEFSDTLGLMKRLDIAKPQTVHNIKRRIRFRAQKILAGLSGHGDGGDSK